MAKLENIVRPVILPGIRPPARPHSFVEDTGDTEGEHIIRGGSGGFIDLPYSWSQNKSKQKHRERKRRVDKVRIYQKEEDGTVNKENFIDVEVANKLWMNESGAGEGGGSTDLESPSHFAKVKEEDNIEFIKRNIVKNNPDF